MALKYPGELVAADGATVAEAVVCHQFEPSGVAACARHEAVALAVLPVSLAAARIRVAVVDEHHKRALVHVLPVQPDRKEVLAHDLGLVRQRVCAILVVRQLALPRVLPIDRNQRALQPGPTLCDDIAVMVVGLDQQARDGPRRAPPEPGPGHGALGSGGIACVDQDTPGAALDRLLLERHVQAVLAPNGPCPCHVVGPVPVVHHTGPHPDPLHHLDNLDLEVVTGNSDLVAEVIHGLDPEHDRPARLGAPEPVAVLRVDADGGAFGGARLGRVDGEEEGALVDVEPLQPDVQEVVPVPQARELGEVRAVLVVGDDGGRALVGAPQLHREVVAALVPLVAVAVLGEDGEGARNPRHAHQPRHGHLDQRALRVLRQRRAGPHIEAERAARNRHAVEGHVESEPPAPAAGEGPRVGPVVHVDQVHSLRSRPLQSHCEPFPAMQHSVAVLVHRLDQEVPV
mmetsp:Transcript_43879/g.91855  ORF Transcript_43879/g.91855 Transcript_43879/m.91855 type:complete len:457 (+) Transcript_43879:1539-2909(+)